MSGIMIPPFLVKNSSASGVVGPFAPSAIIFAFILEIFALVIWFSKAAGIKISHSCSKPIDEFLNSLVAPL
jgi:hypothetical protein